ncbi:MAG TPA: hypothetical protein VKZ63_13335, partial [Kofleriaceae bacterium]|nr:hypothetical protein [Kofleriaceae bacterium]
MTSSATQTERPAAGQGAAGAGREAADRRERAVRWLAAHIDAVSSGVLLVGGWLLILFVNRWHVGAPSIFLCIGWLGILLAGRSLWRAASVA